MTLRHIGQRKDAVDDRMQPALFDQPHDLVGREIYWATYSGTPLAKHHLDRKFDSECLQIGVNEILGIRVLEAPQGEE